jgi:glycosyltransferase involved in cell wall biosynthesis
MVSDQSKNLAVIIPVYNEGPFIASNLAEIISVIDKIGISCLYTLIDDGSTDSTWAEIQTLKSKYSNLKAIRFSAISVKKWQSRPVWIMLMLICT